jgi:uncharacterized protein (TIGR03083 family)
VASVATVPRLEYPAYLDHIRRESARFRDVLGDCDPSARVPTCPDWDAADLLWHLTGVQRFWSEVVRFRPAGPDDPRIGQEGSAERPAAYDDLLAAFDRESAALVGALDEAEPNDEAWHWSGDNRVGTTHRRQAHEALIHRVDAELAAGVPVTPLDAALADDGVAEAFGVVYGGCPPWGTFSADGPALAVRMTDTGTELTVVLGKFAGTDPDSGTTYADEDDLGLLEDGTEAGDEPAATISGTAADLDTWLWKREAGLAAGWDRGDRIRVEGDRTAFEQLAAVLKQPIS